MRQSRIKPVAAPLPSGELGRLAQRLAKSRSRAASTKLRKRIAEGFYAEDLVRSAETLAGHLTGEQNLTLRTKTLPPCRRRTRP